MERDRSRSGEPVRRTEERGRWRDASQRDREETVESGATGIDAERMDRERKERERVERDRMERERSDRERWERDRRDRELTGRGVGGSAMATRDPLLASHFDFMRQFMREMNRMFEGWGSPMRGMGTSGTPSGYQGTSSGTTPYQGQGGASMLSGWPPIEVEERDGQMLVRAELPGMDLQDVKVRLEGGYLVIEGERREDRKREREGYYETEWSYGHFARRIPVPQGVTADQIHAHCDTGVLELTIDVPNRDVREIPIRRSGERRPEEDRPEPAREELERDTPRRDVRQRSQD